MHSYNGTEDGVFSEQVRENAVAAWAWLIACVVVILIGLFSPANADASVRNDTPAPKTTVAEWVRTHPDVADFFRAMLYLHHTCVRQQPQNLQTCMDTGRPAAKVASTRCPTASNPDEIQYRHRP